jgi:SIR2-like domain
MIPIYRGEGIVLVLGAGVSIGSGLPNWDDLVSGLLLSLLTSQMSASIDEEQALALSDAARKLGNESPLLSARYVRRGFEDGVTGDQPTFHQALSAALYSGRHQKSTRLLDALAKVCVPLRTGAKVHAVITYNFDDLLERRLAGEQIEHRSIYSPRLHPRETELPVYHAHGFLPQDVSNYEGLEEGVLAFSEEGYHQLFRDPYRWTNVMQLQAFQQRTCLFVGLSLTDPNLRRLLEYASAGREDPRHFVFMKRATAKDLLVASKKGESQTAPLREDAATDFLRVHHNLQERVFRELGLDVIWFSKFEEMPAAVTSLRGGPARRVLP